eukprot:scaffold359903_cov331-Cyclotella_meneghiniana.AAC.1
MQFDNSRMRRHRAKDLQTPSPISIQRSHNCYRAQPHTSIPTMTKERLRQHRTTIGQRHPAG